MIVTVTEHEKFARLQEYADSCFMVHWYMVHCVAKNYISQYFSKGIELAFGTSSIAFWPNTRRDCVEFGNIPDNTRRRL